MKRLHLHPLSFIAGVLCTIGAMSAFSRPVYFANAQSEVVLYREVCEGLDASDDGNVDLRDYSALVRYFGKTCSNLSAKNSPTPATNASPSGEAMPVGDIAGWKQIFAEDFKKDAAVGEVQSLYAEKFDFYLDGWPDSAGQQGANSRYYPSRVLRVENGTLKKNVKTETINGVSTSLGAAILPKISSTSIDQLYGKYTVRFRVVQKGSTSLKGFKTAWLLWPQSEVWPRDGEIDFPEGDLSENISAFMHKQGATTGNDQDAFTTSASYADWHTASIEWNPDSVKFYLDGQLIGTSTQRIPNTPMHWVLQTESCLDSCPDPAANGDVEIDWLVAYAKE